MFEDPYSMVLCGLKMLSDADGTHLGIGEAGLLGPSFLRALMMSLFHRTGLAQILPRSGAGS